MRLLLNLLIVNYSGHGGLKSWATESIFANPDVANLDNSGKYLFGNLGDGVDLLRYLIFK